MHKNITTKSGFLDYLVGLLEVLGNELRLGVQKGVSNMVDARRVLDMLHPVSSSDHCVNAVVLELFEIEGGIDVSEIQAAQPPLLLNDAIGRLVLAPSIIIHHCERMLFLLLVWVPWDLGIQYSVFNGKQSK